jgi:putative ABC transport system substrate-binding protein
MRRRDFISLLGGTAATWPLSVRAQLPGKVWHIGMLDTTPLERNAANIDAFRQGLAQLGYVEGQNFNIYYRSADGRIDRFSELADEMVRRTVDLIVTRGTPAALAAKNATSTIPIVMAASGEPVGVGLVKSLAHPGGNVTGLSAFVTELLAKRIELLKEINPRIERIALLDNMGNRSVPPQWEELKKAARILGVESQLLDVRKPEELDRAFDLASNQHVDALAVGNDSVIIASGRRVAELAMKHRLPTMYATREIVDAGGLLSYAVHYPDLYRRAATFVDKIFKGAKPADLPVEQPTAFELVVNLKTAKALGLTIPPTLLAIADEVIE